MKTIITLAVIAGIALIGFLMWSPAESPVVTTETKIDTEVSETEEVISKERNVVPDGAYTVLAEESSVAWAGKKPLVEGYVNSGSIAVESGSIAVMSASATGTFTIDMNTLSVSATPAKPGQESALEGHLKGERWFNIPAFPEASFTITTVTPRAESDTAFIYDVRGLLTMKGVTDELVFPATIYADSDGLLHAEASFEFDRTKWGITSGSGSFFDNLADNVIDDMVALSFDLIAERQ